MGKNLFSLGSKPLSGFGNAFNSFKDRVSNTASNIYDKSSTIAKDAYQKGTEAANSAYETGKNTLNNAYEQGSEYVKGKHRQLLFLPNRKIYSKPEDFGITNYENVSIETPDGENLEGYFIKASKDTNKTIIFFNGQGYNSTMCFEQIKKMQEKIPVNILVVDYRGFGKSSLKSKSVTEEGLITDGKAMYDFLIKKGYKPNDISFCGVSLGGAVATAVATQEGVDIDMLIILSSFTTTGDVAADKVDEYNPFTGKLQKGIQTVAKQAVACNLNSLENIQNVKAKKVIICHGGNDKYIPYWHGIRLFEKVKVKDKEFFLVKEAGHIDVLEHCKEREANAIKEHLANK